MLQFSQPELRVISTTTGVNVIGGYQVLVEGVVCDCFEVRIEIDNRFPGRAPRLFESAGRIPRVPERHMYSETDGECCFGVWAEWLAIGERSMQRFLLETVNDFFFSQHYFELHPELPPDQRWPLGERSHGRQGIVESCARILGVPVDMVTILDALDYVLGTERDRNGLCLCGSGRRFKRCHRQDLWKLRSTLDQMTLRAMITALRR